MTDVGSAIGPMRETGTVAPSRADHGDVRAGSGPLTGRPKAPGTEPPGRQPTRGGARLLAARALALAIAATIVSALTVTGCSTASSTHSSASPTHTSGTSKAKPQANCKSSGCAVVRMSRSLPPFTIFYGASCSGVHGSWFFNTVEGGATNALRPSYSLSWSFAGSATSARPTARIIVPPTKRTRVTLTLKNGTMKLSGVHKPNARVNATGSLIVRLAGSASSPSLIFVERGLWQAEHKLGLVSPFNARGRPLVVHVQHVTSLRGC